MNRALFVQSTIASQDVWIKHSYKSARDKALRENGIKE